MVHFGRQCFVARSRHAARLTLASCGEGSAVSLARIAASVIGILAPCRRRSMGHLGVLELITGTRLHRHWRRSEADAYTSHRLPDSWNRERRHGNVWQD